MASGTSGNADGQPRPSIGQQGFQPSELQRNAFLRALRQMLQPHTVHRFLLIRHLRIANWDVQAAHNSLIAERNTRLGLPAPVASTIPSQTQAPTQPQSQTPTQAQPATPAATAGTPASSSGGITGSVAVQGAADAYRIIDTMHYDANNPEQERRRTVVVFRDQIRGLANNSAALSISQSVLLLQLADWDLGQALKEWQGLEDALDRLHVAFDRMRSPEGDKVADFKKDRARSERQDERLAILINLTGRSDWRSLQLFLMEHAQFNLVKAIVIWFKSGIPVATKAKDKKLTRKDARQNNIPPPADKDVLGDPVDKKWAPETAFFRRVSDFNRQELVPLPPLHEDNRDKRPHGFLIYPERSTIQAGNYFVQDNFVVEYISKGKYWYNRFQKKTVGKGGAPFKWPKFGRGYGASSSSDSDSDPDADKKVVFDFSDRTHVSKLNAWRRQQFARATGVMRRKGSQKWEAIENALLYSLIKEYHDKAVKNLPAGETSSAFKITQKRLDTITKYLNEAFVGTRPGSATAIRGERTPTSVGTQMRRFFPNVRDFKIKGDDAWFSKNRKVTKEAYKAQQIQDLADGTAEYKNWDPANERPAVDEHDSDDEAEAEDYDENIVAGDDDETKERKRHDSRAEKLPIKEAKKKAAAARADQAARAAEGKADDDDEGPDVLNTLQNADSDDEDEEEGDDTVAGDGGEAAGGSAGTKGADGGAKATKKRKRDNGDGDGDDDGAGSGAGAGAGKGSVAA